MGFLIGGLLGQIVELAFDLAGHARVWVFIENGLADAEGVAEVVAFDGESEAEAQLSPAVLEHGAGVGLHGPCFFGGEMFGQILEGFDSAFGILFGDRFAPLFEELFLELAKAVLGLGGNIDGNRLGRSDGSMGEL